jgi:CheY-like chemotaxis protein
MTSPSEPHHDENKPASVPSGFTHRINNPLTTVLYNLESVIHDLDELAATVDTQSVVAVRDMADRLRDALEGAQRIRSIVADLKPQPKVTNAAAGAAAKPDETRSDRPRVLLVDDEPGIGLAITRMFRSEYAIEVRTTGKEGLEAIENGGSFDAILCDLMLPGLTGVDLYTATVMKHPELASRFVFISGGSFAAGTLEFFNRVRNPVLRKPMSPTELREVLRQVVSAARKGSAG